MDDKQMRVVGLIGTGEIGCRIGSLLLAAGYDVIAYDISAPAMNRAKNRGLARADSIADLCRRANLVLTCVTDGDALRDVVAGAGGVAETLPADKILVDTTSAEPWITRELATLLEKKGIQFLDAPVSGGVPAADAGRMNFMIGGDPRLIDRCRPLLLRLGPVITHVGEIGTGHTMKAINMLALAASMLATAELIAIGLQTGHALDDMVRRLDTGIGGSFCTRVHFPRFIAPGNYNSGFTFDLMIKDLSIGIGLAERSNIPLFLQRSAYDFYRVAANNGLRGKDNTRIVQSLMERPRVSRAAEVSANFLDRLRMAAAGCNAVVCAESICLGAAVGISPETVIEVLSASSGDSFVLSNWMLNYLQGKTNGEVPSLSEVRNAIARAVADAMATSVPSPLVNQAMAIHAAAAEPGCPETRSVVELIAAWTGQLRAARRLETGDVG